MIAQATSVMWTMCNMYAKHICTETHIHKEKKEKTDRQTPNCFPPVQQACTFNRFWAPSSVYTQDTS